MITIVAMQAQQLVGAVLLGVALILLVVWYVVATRMSWRTFWHRRPFNYKLLTAGTAATSAVFLIALFVAIERLPHIGWLLLVVVGWFLGVCYVFFFGRLIARQFAKRHEKQRRR